ncbi:MAG: HDOD domain-containing protein [Betaproteobacteria bacterium]|nr:HDOD domain-containing protein [Rhodocyclales bacterium]
MIEQPFADLQSWLAYFREANLPVLRHTMQELERMRTNAENVNGRLLSRTILRDPMMTLRVLAYIESKRRARQTTDITTIERAIMMIGIEPFFRDFQDLPLIEDQLRPHPQALLGLIKVVHRARRAAQWARDWAIVRHDLDVDEITLAALLHDMAELLMWCFAPGIAIQVRDTQAANRNRRSAVVQTEIYGIPLYQLKMALTETWRLPQLLTQLMDNQHAENPRVRNVKLAVDLARHSATSWSDAALPDDFKGIRDLLRISQQTLVRRLGVDEATSIKLLAMDDQPEPADEASRSSEAP